MTKDEQIEWLDDNKAILGNGREHFNLSESQKQSLLGVLKTLDIDVIKSKKRYPVSLKSYLLQILGQDKHILEPLIKTVNFQILKMGNSVIHLEGRSFEKYIDPDFRIYAKNENGEIIPFDYHDAPAYDQGGCFDDLKVKAYSFSADLPAYPGAKYSFFLSTESERKLRINYGKFSRLTNIENSFFTDGDIIVKALNNQIGVYANTLKTRLASSHRLKKSIGNNEINNIRQSAVNYKKQTKPIWIISDRTDSAGDNGEALFTYLMNNEAAKTKYDINFLISEDCTDYLRMSKIGHVISVGSDEHKAKLIAADMVISSSGDEWITNPFGKDRKYFGDLMTFRYAFLQHGVTIHDLSGWLNKLNKNISLFCCVSENERDSVCANNFGYDDTSAKITGFARYDKLKNENRKIICFMPTWRKEIAPELIPGTSDREYSPDFKNTYFFKFYNDMINDERILNVMSEKGYTGIFYPHPNFYKQACDFTENDLIKVYDSIAPYTKAFNESSLMVTDYSSVAMDFAYLRKPIVYTQFDYEDFYAAHTVEEGYFSFEENGFGPVCYDYESAVNEIVNQINNDCIEPGKYKERVDEFFYYNDQKSCERIYAELIRLSEK